MTKQRSRLKKPESTPASPVTAMNGSAGIEAATRLPLWARSNPPALQPKLTVNQPGDPFEQEADRVAEQVMRMPAPAVQRRCACGGMAGPEGECAACKAKHQGKTVEMIRTKRAASAEAGTTAAPPGVHRVLNSPGKPLDAASRAYMEPRFGADFSQVRVHTDAQAAESAQVVEARAYTVGHNIVFAAGQYAPGTGAGRQLLAHELTHVVQQQSPANANIRPLTLYRHTPNISAPGQTGLQRFREPLLPYREATELHDCMQFTGDAEFCEREVLGSRRPPLPPPTPQVHLTNDLREFFHAWEGFRPQLYEDRNGHCTIGVGHLVHRGPCNGTEPANFRRGITRREGDELFANDLERVARAILGAVYAPLNQHQFDALLSFAFHMGVGRFRRQIAPILNRRQYEDAIRAMAVYSPSPRAARRRQAEAAIFRNGDYSGRP